MISNETNPLHHNICIRDFPHLSDPPGPKGPGLDQSSQALALSAARAAPARPRRGGTAATAGPGGPVGHRSAEAEPLRQAPSVGIKPGEIVGMGCSWDGFMGLFVGMLSVC